MKNYYVDNWKAEAKSNPTLKENHIKIIDSRWNFVKSILSFFGILFVLVAILLLLIYKFGVIK